MSRLCTEHGMSPSRRPPGSEDFVSAGTECFEASSFAPARSCHEQKLRVNGGQYMPQDCRCRLLTGRRSPGLPPQKEQRMASVSFDKVEKAYGSTKVIH